MACDYFLSACLKENIYKYNFGYDAETVKQKDEQRTATNFKSSNKK